MATTEIATLAGGCFWGMEDLFRKIPGVVNTDVGYTGGTTAKATYQEVKTGSTMHAEALQVEFNPEVLSYEDLLLFFFRVHDPTTVNQQGNDIGTQYRSEIFYHSDQQRQTAEKVIERVNKSGAWSRPVATKMSPAKEFHVAEDYHQDYLEKSPNGYTCHYIRRIEY